MGLQAKEKFPFFKNDQKSMTSHLRVTAVLFLVVPLWNHFQKNFLSKTYKNIKNSAQSQIAHMVKNGSEVEQFFALFDPLCPDLASQGPTPLVIRSTSGALPNHTPTSLVRLPIAVLCPKNENPSKQGSKS